MSKPWLMLLFLTSALVAWLFAPALSGGWSFAFRDAAHFYYPLFEYIRDEWGAGRVPLWNPYENIGVPLVAENTSSVFYPGKLLFVLPLDYTWLYNVYIVSHVVLAVATSYALARHLRSSPLGAVLGGLSYAFCANVLFQYCNVIFLVGAAWLPLALLYADRMLRLGQGWACLGFGVVVALIVLGGDPHLAYNIGLAAAGYALLLWLDEWRGRRASPAAKPGDARPRRFPWRLASLAFGTLVAAALSAIQVLPSLEASPYGDRARFDVPRNVYEYAEARLSAQPGERVSYAGLLGGEASGHHEQVYSFSVEPWRAIEMVWPNVTGRPFVSNRRWLSALSAEYNLWTPSLYMGLLPLVLAILSFRLRRPAPVEIRGLSWLALLSALASLGWYGPGWLVQSALGTGNHLDIGGEVGGVYWLLATLLPGYIQFRYPHKLFVLASLALSMLAARGWRHAWRGKAPVRTALVVVAGMSMAAAAAALIGEHYLQQVLVKDVRNKFDGPFDWTGAWTDLADGLLHGFVLSLVLAAVFTVARRQAEHLRLLQWGTLAIVAVDLGVAGRPLIEYAPARLWQFRPAVVERLGSPAQRVYRQEGLLPPAFELASSPQRYDEALVHGRQTLLPKYPLADRVPVMEVGQSVAGSDFEMLLEAARRYTRRVRRMRAPDASILELLGINWAVVGPALRGPLQDVQEIAGGAYLGRLNNPLPRAWIVHQVEVHEPLRSRSPRAVRDHTLEIMFPGNQTRDWRREAVIETKGPIKLPAAERAEIPAGESCTIEYADPLRVEIVATLQSDGLVVLADQYFPGWDLTVETAGESRRVPILRTNRVMRGAVLPAGEHRLVYRYRPKSFLYGALVSAASVGALAIAGCGLLWRMRAAR